MGIQLVIGFLDLFKDSLGQNSGGASVESNLGFFFFFLSFFTVFRVLFVLWLARSLAKARDETQWFIGMFLTIILWF